MTIQDDAGMMAEKFRAAEEKVARERGGFTLFGLFERAPGRWDLVASAPWLETGYDGTQELIVSLRDNMEVEDWKLIVGVFPLNPSAAYVRWITGHYLMKHQVEEIHKTSFNDVYVSRAFLITADPSPVPAPAHLVAA